MSGGTVHQPPGVLGAPLSMVATGFGARGDGAHDDTAAIQEMLNALAAAGGGVGFLPAGRYLLSASLTPGENVELRGANPGSRIAVAPTTILDGAQMAAPVIASNAQHVTIRDLAIYGNDAQADSVGISSALASWWLIENVFLSDFGGCAILIGGGTVTKLLHVKAQNAVSVRGGHAGPIGCVDIAANDFMIDHCEFTTSSAANDSGNGWISALVIRGDAGFVHETICEESETGCWITNAVLAGGIRLVGVRCDLNQTNGFQVDGIRSDLVGCLALRNSQAATNTYDGFLVTGTENNLQGCRAISLGAAPQMRYGFTDTSATGNVNSYQACRASNMATGIFNFAAVVSGIGPPTILYGPGGPAGVVSARPGTLYVSTAGGAGTTLYVKEIGNNNAGWAAK